MKEVAAGILVLIGGLVALYGFVKYLVVIYRHGLLWFLFCLIVLPVGPIAFLILHPRESLKPFLLFVCGIGVEAVGCWLWPGIMEM